jgi:phosphoribosyl-ATP pyrophosphohydrolase
MALVIEDLVRTIAARAVESPDISWTAKLLAQGTPKIAKKVGEEAVEVVIEAMRGDKTALVSESADLLYHLLVLFHAHEVAWADVLAELATRKGVSGLAEKAARPA